MLTEIKRLFIIQKRNLKYRFSIAINSLQNRFYLLNHYCSNFGFLYNISLLKNWKHKTLLNYCKDLATLLTENESSDIDAIVIFENLKMSCQLTESNSSPNKNLELIGKKKIQEVYPNITISLRIVLTILVTTESAERSWNLLKPPQINHE